MQSVQRIPRMYIRTRKDPTDTFRRTILNSQNFLCLPAGTPKHARKRLAHQNHYKQPTRQLSYSHAGSFRPFSASMPVWFLRMAATSPARAGLMGRACHGRLPRLTVSSRQIVHTYAYIDSCMRKCSVFDIYITCINTRI